MACPYLGFDPDMKNSLKRIRVFLVETMTVEEGLLDHLLEKSVFSNTQISYIKAKSPREEQVRKLLGDLEKRPGGDFWKFLESLYQTRQGHIAERILMQYHGEVDPEIKRLQKEFLQQHQAPQKQKIDSGRHQDQLGRSPPPSRLPAANYDQSFRMSESGGIISCPTSDHGVSAMEMDQSTEFQHPCARSQVLQQTLPAPISESRRHDLSVYENEKLRDPNAIYKMESTPRGLMLLIDNEEFSYFPNREGTKTDSEELVHLFKDLLNFEVVEHANRTAGEMRTAMENFIRDPRLPKVDSCVVAVLTHGTNSDVLFGIDGSLNGSMPQTGTYIKTFEIRNYLSARSCPALEGKPKLLILQACKGNLEDVLQGPIRSCGVDVVTDCQLPSGNPQGPDMADFYTLSATVENFVAYRNNFIQHLSAVFQEKMHTKHVRDMTTDLNRRMSTCPVNNGCWTIPEERGHLTRNWFLNPP